MDSKEIFNQIKDSCTSFGEARRLSSQWASLSKEKQETQIQNVVKQTMNITDEMTNWLMKRSTDQVTADDMEFCFKIVTRLTLLRRSLKTVDEHLNITDNKAVIAWNNIKKSL